MKAPLAYRDDPETLDADQGQVEQKLNETFDVILERTAEDSRQAVRVVHAKSHGILGGEFEAGENLPAKLAQGVFARSGKHLVYEGLSTNAGDIVANAISPGIGRYSHNASGN